MNNGCFLSFLIPLYNTSLNYLETLLVSIERSVKEVVNFSYEIIICQQDKRDISGLASRFGAKVIHLEHASSMISRIILLKHANGKYAWLVDSDDAILKGSIKYIVDLIKNTSEKDVYLFKILYSHDSSNLLSEQCETDNQILEFPMKTEAMWSFLSGSIKNNLCGKIFKTDLNITIPEIDVFMWEDSIISYCIINAGKSFCVSTTPIYIARRGDITGTSGVKVKFIDDLMKVLLFFKSIDNQNKRLMCYRILEMIIFYLRLGINGKVVDANYLRSLSNNEAHEYIKGLIESRDFINRYGQKRGFILRIFAKSCINGNYLMAKFSNSLLQLRLKIKNKLSHHS